MKIYLNDLSAGDENALFAIVSKPDFFYAYINQSKGNDPGKLFQAAADYVCLAETSRQQQPRAHMMKAIRAQEDHRLLGCVVLVDIKDSAVGKDAEIGFFVDPPFQRQKIGLTAAVSLVDWAWREIGLRTMHTTVDPENSASIKLLQNLGLSQTGFLDAAQSIYSDRDGSKRPRLLVASDFNATKQSIQWYRHMPKVPILADKERPTPGASL